MPLSMLPNNFLLLYFLLRHPSQIPLGVLNLPAPIWNVVLSAIYSGEFPWFLSCIGGPGSQIILYYFFGLHVLFL